ncbi:hypothetical protein MRX96_030923 [Rhipicephalus microplus]
MKGPRNRTRRDRLLRCRTLARGMALGEPLGLFFLAVYLEARLGKTTHGKLEILIGLAKDVHQAVLSGCQVPSRTASDRQSQLLHRLHSSSQTLVSPASHG